LRTEIRHSAVIGASAEEVWAILRDFNGHERWHPAVAASAIEGGAPADQIGAVRDFRLKGGARVREQLLALSDRRMTFAYCILEAPEPLRNYVATVRVRPITDAGVSLVEWRSRFDPPESDRERLTRFVRDDIINAGLASLRALFERRSVAAASHAVLPAPTARSTARGIETYEIVIARYGGPEVLELSRGHAPDPGLGEVRIRQTAVGVNFIDVYCRRGSFDLVPPGGVPGMEAAGVVDSVGPGVADLQRGDRVAYACAPPGAYATLRTIRADMLVPLPASLGDAEVAGLLLKGVTAGFLLHDVAHVTPGAVVVVHAAAGGVGQILARWAKALGATVIGVTSSDAKAEAARRAGCDAVAISSRDALADVVMRATAGRGADVVFDAVGKDMFESSLNALATRGHLVSFGQASGDIGSRSIDRLTSRSVTLSRPNYVHYTDDAEKMRRQSERLFAAVRSGAVVVHHPRTFALAEASVAHAELESRRTTGSLALIP
jgi:NADPH:quinone reductase-like Zn-dependent oxidoreductase